MLCDAAVGVHAPDDTQRRGKPSGDSDGRAPTELIIGLDPETLAREQGALDERAAKLLAEGRSLRVEASRELARGVARID